jgi:hypothetical protein
MDSPSCRRKRSIPAGLFCAPIVAAIVLAMTGCGPRDRAFAPSNFAIHGLVLPAEVILPTDTTGGLLHNFDGLYVETAETSVCCWIAPQATLLVKKPGVAKTFVAGFYTPKYPIFDRGQYLTIRFAGDKRAFVKHIGSEQQSIRIPLPARLRAAPGPMRVHVDSRVVFVPSLDTPASFSWRALVGLHAAPSTDDRDLGAILLYAYFE